MINLAGKSVFVKTQEEYLSVLKMAKLQGFTWARENHLNHVEIPIPNILNFYSSKMVTYRDNERTLYEASEIVEDEEKIKDAVNLVRTFAKSPDRTALTESFIDSLKLLADTVESQMEEVKQMIKISKIAFEALRDTDGNVSRKPSEWWRSNKLACIWCILCMLAEIPIAILSFVLMTICFIPYKIYEHLEDMSFQEVE